MKKINFLLLIGVAMMSIAMYSAATGIPFLAIAAVFALLAFVPKAKGVAYTNINITDLIAEFGNYYIEGSANIKRLRTLLRQNTVTPLWATPILTNNTKERGSTAVIGEVIQAFQKQFTAKGDPKFLPEEYNLFNVKVDTEFYPDDVKKSWLGFMASMEEAERKNWPIVRYVMEELIVPRYKQDLELKAYYHGSYVAPTPGTPGPAAASMDGIRKLLTNSRVNDLNLGTVQDDNMVEAVEAAIDVVPDLYSSESMRIFMAPRRKMAYARDYRNLFGTTVTYTERKAVQVDFAPNYEIVALPSMQGCNDIWITPASNFQHMRHTNSAATPQVESAKRQVSLMMDWWEGFAIGILEMVWFHKQDGSGSGS